MQSSRKEIKNLNIKLINWDANSWKELKIKSYVAKSILYLNFWKPAKSKLKTLKKRLRILKDLWKKKMTGSIKYWTNSFTKSQNATVASKVSLKNWQYNILRSKGNLNFWLMCIKRRRLRIQNTKSKWMSFWNKSENYLNSKKRRTKHSTRTKDAFIVCFLSEKQVNVKNARIARRTIIHFSAWTSTIAQLSTWEMEVRSILSKKDDCWMWFIININLI